MSMDTNSDVHHPARESGGVPRLNGRDVLRPWIECLLRFRADADGDSLVLIFMELCGCVKTSYEVEWPYICLQPLLSHSRQCIIWSQARQDTHITYTLLSNYSIKGSQEKNTLQFRREQPPGMLASTLSPRPQRRSPALEAMLSSLEASEDLLSGSECSSLATTPIKEVPSFSFEPQPSEHQDQNSKAAPLEPIRSTPVEVVKEFLEHVGEADAANKLIASDAIVECYSLLVPGDEQAHFATSRKDLKNLQAACRTQDLQIDNILSSGEDVAAFGHFAYSACPLGLPRNVYFSIWAKVDAERARIVYFRWLDQVVRVEDLDAGDHLEKDVFSNGSKETKSMFWQQEELDRR